MEENDSEFEMLSLKSDAAWNAIQNQYVNRITDAEIDHLFARLVFGLTSPIYVGLDPALHFRACETLVGRKMPQERARAALHAVPEASEPWVEKAFDLAEAHGTRIGTALAEQRGRIDRAEVEADAAHRELPGAAEGQGG